MSFKPTSKCCSSLLLLIAAGRLSASVDLERVPDSWTAAPPPAATAEAYRKADISCERFFTRNDGLATLIYNTRKPTWTSDPSSYRGAIQGLIEGFAEAGNSRGRPAEMNEVIRPAGLELVCQELSKGEYRTTILTQLTPSKLEQVVVSYPPSEREEMVKMATALFTLVPPPMPTKASSEFESGFRTGKVLGEATVYLAILGIVAAAIVALMIQKKRKGTKPLPPAP